jgi:hypothetical protein
MNNGDIICKTCKERIELWSFKLYSSSDGREVMNFLYDHKGHDLMFLEEDHDLEDDVEDYKVIKYEF